MTPTSTCHRSDGDRPPLLAWPWPDLAEDALPQVLVVSPYRRARETAALACAEAGLDLPVQVDERLRDRELGVFDRLTFAGIEARFPEEAERRQWHGKFYHRPSGRGVLGGRRAAAAGLAGRRRP